MKSYSENVRCPEGLSVFDTTLDGLPNAYHFHAQVEILRIEGAHGTATVGDVPIFLHRGQWLVFGSNLPHAVHGIQARGKQPQVHVTTCLQFSENCAGEDFFKVPAMREIANWLSGARRGYHYQSGVDATARPVLAKLGQARGPAQIRFLLELLEILSSFPRRKVLASEGYSVPLEGASFTRVAKVLKLIDSRYSEPLGLDEMASVAGMGRTSFCRHFRRKMGVSPVTYLIRQRIGHARKELVETEDTISEVAFRCGFNNLSHFNRQFREHFGETPRDLRRKLSRVER